MKFLLFLSFLLAVTPLHAQVAAGSHFKSMRSENPAVISERPAATLAIIYKMDKVDKEQDTTGPISSSQSEIEISTASFFYGSKGGKFLTTEISGEMSSGEKNDNVTTSGNSTTQKTEADLIVLNAAAAIGKNFGLGVMSVSNESEQSGSISQISKTSLMIYTVGAKFNLGLDFGAFYQHAPLDSAGGQEIDMSRVGFGIGASTKKFHLEVAYIKNLEDEKEELGGGSGAGENVATHSPAKIMGSLEFKLGGISLGVTSNYYIEGFFDFNNLMYYTMVMANNKENRLENTFNFSFGGDKGHSFSGGLTISTVESTEAPPTLLSGTKYKTTTNILGFNLNYSYNF